MDCRTWPDRVKIITWNVNGIRARHAQLDALLAEECPDIVCLQEIKAAPDQVPELLVAATDHWTFWHGAGGYSGVALLVRHSFFTERPVFSHPSFDVEHRVVVADLGAIQVASVYVPNGGKDYEAKLRFFDGFAGWATETIGTGRTLLICGDLNIAREERDVHPKERKPNQVGTRPEERERFARLLDTGLVDVGRALDPGERRVVHLVGPLAESPAAEYRLAHRLRAGQHGAGRAGVSSVSRRDYGTSDHAPLVVVRRGNPNVQTAMSLRTRLIVAFFVLAVLPLAAVTFYTYQSNEQALREAAEREADLLAGELGQRMQLVTAQLSQRVEHLMDIQELETALRAAESEARTEAPVQSTAVVASADSVLGNQIARSLGEAAMLLNNVQLQGLRGRGGPAGRRSYGAAPWEPGRPAATARQSVWSAAGARRAKRATVSSQRQAGHRHLPAGVATVLSGAAIGRRVRVLTIRAGAAAKRAPDAPKPPNAPPAPASAAPPAQVPAVPAAPMVGAMPAPAPSPPVRP